MTRTRGLIMSYALALWLSAPALLGGVTSCAAESDQVELRLFPCQFDGIEPRAVVVELTGFDAQGEIVETFEIGFDNIAAQVFEDGFATVGYRKDARVVRARIRLGWFSTPTAGSIAEAEAIAVYEDLAVPAVGEVLSLGSDVGDCSELAGGDGDGDPTTGDGDGDPTTGDGDGAPGEDLPEVGDDCDGFNSNFHCVPELDAQAGSPLFCSPITNKLEPTDVWQMTCAGLCTPGSSNPIEGCAGFGHPARCLCHPDQAEACADATLGCTGDGHLKLCNAGTVVIAQCNNCSMTPGGYFSCSR